jgi:hypothetical protein
MAPQLDRVMKPSEFLADLGLREGIEEDAERAEVAQKSN